MIKLNDIRFENDGKKIIYDYEYDKTIAKFFSSKETFFVEFDIDVSDTPLSIAVVPFLANVLPIAWFAGFDVHVDETDAAFMQGMEIIRKQLQSGNTFADLSKSKLHFKKSVNNEYQASRTAMLFSGGVDAYATYFRHFDEKCDLITIHGADVELEDVSQWNRVVALNENEPLLAENAKFYITSNIRTFYTHHVDLLMPNVNWWWKVQHGLALNSVVAPLAYVRKYRTLYIASTFTNAIQIDLGSMPEIDNNIQWGSTRVSHDCYDLNRQAKVDLIIKSTKKIGRNINIRVCYSLLNKGVNCSHCEKCSRTIIALIVAGANPNDYGFTTSATIYDRLFQDLKGGFHAQAIQHLWQEILEKSYESPDFFVFADKETETRKMQALQQLIETNVANGLRKKSRLYKVKFKIQNTFPKMFKMYLNLRKSGL